MHILFLYFKDFIPNVLKRESDTGFLVASVVISFLLLRGPVCDRQQLSLPKLTTEALLPDFALPLFLPSPQLL